MDNHYEPLGQLDTSDLVLGGTNLHQDIHFSTFYLRASLDAETQPEYPGYSFILSIYEHGLERYFVSRREAEWTARFLIRRLSDNPQWLRSHLARIEQLSQGLASVFSDDMTADWFKQADINLLLSIYENHNALHRDLYRVARIPEALDRGRPFFSDHLRNCLNQSGVSADELNGVFEQLTQPSKPSIISEEHEAFCTLARDLALIAPELGRTHSPLMFLPASARQAMASYAEKWRWLSYHGYRNRTVPSETQLVHRLIEHMREPSWREKIGDSAPRHYQHSDSAKAAIERIDQPTREMFRIYSEIGRIKLIRRYWQLRNFHFLDLLLAEFASRLGASEWQIRCLRPEELLVAIKGGAVSTRLASRLECCALLYSADGEYELTAKELESLQKTLRDSEPSIENHTELRATPACIGFARGTARIVNGYPSTPIEFRRGDVLICEAADPDLLPMLRQAGAVVTQQGGVTSHAAVLCREIGVPTIIGAYDILRLVHDGDVVEVDAHRGVITNLSNSRKNNAFSPIIPRADWKNHRLVGAKAANLHLANHLGFRVPAFVLLSWDQIVHQLRYDEGRLRESLSEVLRDLTETFFAQPTFILRSSALDEDNADATRAGAYASVKMGSSTDALDEVREFVGLNRSRGYGGSVIAQCFLPASACGVSIDGDPRTGLPHMLIAEFVCGQENYVTEGRGRPHRLTYDRVSGDVHIEKSVDTPAADLPLGRLVEWLSKTGQTFGRPAYSEWGYFDGEYWLYQVRGRASSEMRSLHAN